MQKQRIFVVDDDPGMLRLITANLNARGYETVSSSNGSLALKALEVQEPDLTILDILMPGLDGIELLRRLRDRSSVPILMVSAKADVAAKLETLDLGADDYLTKPFSVEELLARVRAVLRRAESPNPQEMSGSYISGDLAVYLDRSEVFRGGDQVKLSAQEWAVLRFLVKYAGRVVTQRKMLQHVWGPEYGDEGDYVRTYITRLRKKLEPEPHVPRYILTERGIGYRLVNPNGPPYMYGEETKGIPSDSPPRDRPANAASGAGP